MRAMCPAEVYLQLAPLPTQRAAPLSLRSEGSHSREAATRMSSPAGGKGPADDEVSERVRGRVTRRGTNTRER